MQAWGRGAGLLPQTSISLNRDAVDVVELSALLAATRQNCLQFPLLHSNGSLVQAAHPSKLRLALRHSTLVVSIHMRGPIPGGDYMHRTEQGQWQEKEGAPSLNLSLTRPRAPSRLIAFGRATSDHTLTASIHDLAVAPSLQRRGFGRQVLQRLLSLYISHLGYAVDMNYNNHAESLDEEGLPTLQPSHHPSKGPSLQPVDLEMTSLTPPPCFIQEALCSQTQIL